MSAPWRMRQTEPTLRAIPQASSVAKLLTDAYTSHVQASEALERSGANIASLNADTDAQKVPADPDGKDVKAHDPHHIPRPLVMMAAGAALLTVLVVAFAQWTGIGDLRANAGLPEFSQEIQFLPLEGDRIAVQNVADGSLITTVEAGTDGLLRGALRGLGMSRNHSGFDLAAPYQLQRFAEDGVYLSDALTGRSIRLDSFGPLETGATADLLRYGHSGGN
jgi:putative photosynthetic complex assembly protein